MRADGLNNRSLIIEKITYGQVGTLNTVVYAALLFCAQIC